jgi:hypothetical protein
VTDTGETAELLDLAAEVWPEVSDRRQLLIRLTEVGARTLRAEIADRHVRRERQRAGLQRAAGLVDADELIGNGAWR